MNTEHARIAEEAGAVAVMALERVPADIRKQGGVSRMSDPAMIKRIIGISEYSGLWPKSYWAFRRSSNLDQLEIDYIDESEVLTAADEENHIDKFNYKCPFVCGARNLGEALRRISEGAAMIRTKGEAGTGNVVEAVRHARAIQREIKVISQFRS